MQDKIPFVLKIPLRNSNLSKDIKISKRVDECNRNGGHLGRMIKDVFVGEERYYCGYCGRYDPNYLPKE